MARILRLGLLALTFAFTHLGAVRADEKIPVVATFSIVGDLTQRIGGDAISLTTLVGPDEDAHVFEPAADAQRAVAGAKLLVANGLGFEPWLQRLTEAAAFKGRLVEATKGIEPLAWTGDEEGHDANAGAMAEDHDPDSVDPHAFQDPKLVLTYIDNIAAGLAEVDPADAPTFQRNADALKLQYRALDADLTASIGILPADKKRVLTSHDAFQYFGHAYGIQFIGVQGVSTESEPSARDLKNIVEQIKAGKINAVFIENMNDPRFIESLSADTGIAVGGDLYADALSGPDGPAGDLLSLYRHNQEELLKALK